jgi:cupin 2 domain-containing protein
MPRRRGIGVAHSFPGTKRIAAGEFMTTVTNLLAELPVELPEEIFQTLVTAPNLLVERIVSLGHASAADCWLDEDRHEWVLLLTGAARLLFEGEEPVDLLPGTAINIPAHKRHRVDWTAPDEPTIWLAIHYI